MERQLLLLLVLSFILHSLLLVFFHSMQRKMPLHQPRKDAATIKITWTTAPLKKPKTLKPIMPPEPKKVEEQRPLEKTIKEQTNERQTHTTSPQAKLIARLSTFAEGDISQGVAVSCEQKVANEHQPSNTAHGIQESNDLIKVSVPAASNEIEIKDVACNKLRSDSILSELNTAKKAPSHLPKNTVTKQKTNIIGMTRCYLDNIFGSTAGNALINRDGVEGIQQSLEDQAYTTYTAKVLWSLQSTWKKHRCQHPRSKPCPAYSCRLSFLIDAHGNVISCSLLVSTGNYRLDKAIIETVYSAAPYPPMPSYLKSHEYHYEGVVNVWD